MTNGADKGPLAGWALVLLGARTLIGKIERAESGPRLFPVYELQVQLDPRAGPAYMAYPVMFLSGLRYVVLPGGAIVVPMGDLSHAERAMLARVVAQAEEMVGKLRAVETGIVPVGKGSVVLK